MKVRKCSLNIGGPCKVSLTFGGSYEYLFYYGKEAYTVLEWLSW
jgi:hypothetical protein